MIVGGTDADADPDPVAAVALLPCVVESNPDKLLFDENALYENGEAVGGPPTAIDEGGGPPFIVELIGGNAL